MIIEILESGPLTTVQDAGRPGWRAFGVSRAGPMDRLAFEMANLLAGNGADAAALEFAGVGGRFRFDRDTAVAVTGPDVTLSIDGTAAEAHRTLVMHAGQELRIGAVRAGLWGYLAINGGIATPPVLGSRATHLRFGLGGLEGRSLAAGDRLPLQEVEALPPVRIAPALPAADPSPVRVIPGPQDDYFDAAVMEDFFAGAYRISTKLDRMAMVLEGKPLVASRGHDIISDGTVPGSIQVPGSGQPLILLAEGQTTGGYPKIATVIGADMRRLAQMGPGFWLRFSSVTPEAAEAALAAYRDDYRTILASIRMAQAPWPVSSRLMSENLVSGLWYDDP